MVHHPWHEECIRIYHPRWAFNLGCSPKFSSQTPSLTTYRAKEWAKSEKMKSCSHPSFWKWKIQVQKIKPCVSGVCWKSKIKWHKRWKLQCPTCVPKNTLIYKIIISPQDASAQQMAQHKPKTNPNRTMLHTCFHTCFTHTLVLKHQQGTLVTSQ